MIWIGSLIIVLRLLLCINKGTRCRGIEHYRTFWGAYIILFPYWRILFFVGFFMIFFAFHSHWINRWNEQGAWAGGEKHVICKYIDYRAPSEPISVPTREGNLKYIEDDRVQQICRDSLSQLERLGIEVRPIKNRYFSLWYRNKRFIYLGCKRKFFICKIQKLDGTWTYRLHVETQEDWEQIFGTEIVPIYKKMGGSPKTLEATNEK